jgi:hypothetical protein
MQHTQHVGVRRETSRTDQSGVIATQRTTFRRASFVLPTVLTLAAAGAAYYFRFSIAHSIWPIVSSPAIASILFAIVLTIGVCGSIASAVIWWVCRGELRASLIQRTAIRQNLAVHGNQISNEERRQAA